VTTPSLSYIIITMSNTLVYFPFKTVARMNYVMITPVSIMR